MSSEVSAAEKKRLLRERRQARFKSGGADARINRIASTNSSFAGTEPTKVQGKSNISTTQSNKPSHRANRISSILDPETVNTSFDKTSKSFTIQEENESDSKLTPQDQALAQLLGGNGNSKINNGMMNDDDDLDVGNPQDILAQLLSGANNDSNPFMNGQSPLGDQGDLFSKILNNGGAPGGAFSNDPNILYNEYRSNRVKAFFQICRIIDIVLLGIYGFFHLDIRLRIPNGDETVTSSVDVNGPILFKYFMSLEAVFIAGFLAFVQSSKGAWFQYDSIIPKSILGMIQMFIPPRIMGYISKLNKGYQILSNFSSDLAVLVFVLSVLSFIY